MQPKVIELLHEAYALDSIAMGMRRRGLLCDGVALERHRVQITAQRHKYALEFSTMVPDWVKLGENASTASIKKYFFETLKVRPKKYSLKTKAPALDDELLQSLRGDIRHAALAGTVLNFRKMSKLLSTYIDGLPMWQGRVHTRYNVLGAVTRRWSSRGPNLQNIPSSMRDIFVPDPGMLFVAADYSALELRVVAAIAGAKKLLQWFKEGKDVHTMNAQEMLGFNNPTPKHRNIAKAIIYTMNYGGGAEKIHSRLVLQYPEITILDVKKILSKYFMVHPEMKAYQETRAREAADNGYVTETLSGWRLHFPLGEVKPTLPPNFPIQAGASTIMNAAVLRLNTLLKCACSPIHYMLQVHDENVIMGSCIPCMYAIIKSAMETELVIGSNRIILPVNVEVGKNWADTEELQYDEETATFVTPCPVGDGYRMRRSKGCFAPTSCPTTISPCR